MTCARREIVNPQEVGIYHCVSRCVRRAFLCGWDRLTRRSFEHRREWVRSRLAELSEIFALDVIAYAILMNHFHVLLRIRPDAAREWSAEDVAKRWRRLFPRRRIDGKPAEPSQIEIQEITSKPEMIALYRERLCSLSWFNRCLNERIARRANAEDQCSGRFWEGRFKCQRVEDLGAVLACAAYIDLNPIRAGVAKSLESSDHTSIQSRIHAYVSERPERCRHWAEVRLISIRELSDGVLDERSYLQFVEQTGRQIRKGRSRILPETVPILEKIRLRPENWIGTVTELGRRFRRIIAPVELINAAAIRSSKSRFHGIGAARLTFAN